MQHKPFTYLHWTYTDGTRGVFCELSTRRVRPCNGRLTLDFDNSLITGVVIYRGQRNTPYFLCTDKCAAAFMRSKIGTE